MPDRVTGPFILLGGTVAGAIGLVLGGVVLLGRQSAPAADASQVPAQPAIAVAAAPSPTVMMDRQFKDRIQPFLSAHCYKCHANGKHKGDITLDKFKDFSAVENDLDTWQSVHDELDQGDMPPEKEPQPPADQLKMVMSFAAKSLDFYDPSFPIDPGFVAVHRLNRNEYNNTIHDLVGVNFRPADDFPADDTGYGFDNIAAVLSMSPLLAEKYLAAAEQVMDKAIVLDNPNKSKITTYAAEEMDGGESVPGGRELSSNGDITQVHPFRATATYEFRIQAAQDQAGNEPARMRVSVGGQVIQTFPVRNHRSRPQAYTFRTKVHAGPQPVVFSFINDFYDPTAKNPKRRDRNLYVNSLEIEGPLDLAPPAPSEIQRRLLFCGPADGSAGQVCAQQIISAFATRAFRRPPTAGELGRLVKLYDLGRQQGESFPQACKFALTAVLVAPQFLYRIENDPPHSMAPHPLSDYELASRLSYFLWSSMPDDELLQLAGQNKLHQPAVLDQQVRRMLADAKSEAFIRNFSGQWLELRNLSQDSPDPVKFPQFTSALRDDMREEGEMFFRHILRDDCSVLDLLNANYTFLDARLAAFYGISGVSGDEFRKVEFTPAEAKQRGGVLTMAGVLTVSALPNRTSPVRRGKFILDQILGQPTPPPPPGIPPLAETGESAKNLSVRQRLELHRTNPMCASCHARLDPLGFALENFDAIGRWRTTDDGIPIDSSGALPDGEKIDGSLGLRKLLVAHKDQFLRAFVSKLMTYAIGRGPTPADAVPIRRIYRQSEQKDCRFSSIIDGIVHSDLFLKRRAKSAS